MRIFPMEKPGFYHPLHLTMGRIDRAILMRDTAIVAGGRHAVVAAQRIVSDGPVLLDLRGGVAESGREAVAAILARCAADCPERVLQSRSQRHEALATKKEVGVLGDRHPGITHIGAVGQNHPARLMGLAEDHLPLRTVERPPLANAPLQRPPDPEAQIRMSPHQLLEDGDGPQATARLPASGRPRSRRRPPGDQAAPLARRALLRRRPRFLLMR